MSEVSEDWKGEKRWSCLEIVDQLTSDQLEKYCD